MTGSRFEPIVRISAVPLIIDKADVDTDQILPARFLTTTRREGLGEAAFYDWRHDRDGALVMESPLNSASREQRRVLVCGRNFGCGSSREHAPWALYDFGVRVVLGEAIADIFKNNALKTGIAAIDIEADVFESIRLHPGRQISVDLETSCVELGDGTKVRFKIDELGRLCLLQGEDQLGYLLVAADEIDRYERAVAAKPVT